MELKDRVKAARAHANITQGELAAAVKKLLSDSESFSQQSVTKIESGSSKKTAYIAHIAYVTGTNPFWLAFESGEMTGGMIAVPPATYGNEKAHILIELFNDMDEARQEHLIQTAKMLSHTQRFAGTTATPVPPVLEEIDKEDEKAG